MRGCACRGTAGFAHVSCWRAGRILVAEARKQFGGKVLIERWERWYKCSLCEQQYHGVVVRDRVGVLNVRGAAGDERGSEERYDTAWERIRAKTPRGRCQ